jgi:CRISPR-associated protein Cas2
METLLNNYSPYRAMWLFAMFDLPVKTKKQRRRYTEFRKGLLKEGFFMMQYSVYARFCESEDSAKGHRFRVKNLLPPEGQIRLVSITDVQFGKMMVYNGKREKEPEKKPEQLILF